MLGLIIQARLGSTRLPKKMVLPFYEDKGVLELIIEKIINQVPLYKLIVATTSSPLDDDLVKICRKLNVNFYRGSESNVLKRFIKAAEENGFSKIIRICADNPFIDIERLQHLINILETNDLDYCSYKTSEGKPTILTHYGFWAEGVSLKALKKVNELTTDAFYLEHVTNFIYKNPELFKIQFIGIDPEIEKHKNIRMTLDTIEDFNSLKEIYSESLNKKINNTADLVNLVCSNKNWTDRMQLEIEKNSK